MKNEESVIGVDLSMRSTGIVRLSLTDKLIDFAIISEKNLDYEELLIYNANEIVKFVQKEKTSYIAFEGLSFGGKSAMIDTIDGNHWHSKCMIRKTFNDLLIGVIPVLSWRSTVLTKDERKEAKKVKNGLKIFVVNKLPTYVKNSFMRYIEKHKLPKASIWDLADAFFIAKYRNSIEDS